MNDDLVERLKEARWMLQSGGLSRASNSVLEAIAELTRLRKENEETTRRLRGERDVLRKSWNACRQLALDAITESGEVPLVDGRDLSSALGFAWYAEPTEGGTLSSKSTEERP